jgi:hypothetical protein
MSYMRKRRKLKTKKSCKYIFGSKRGCTEVLIPASGPNFQFQRTGKEKVFKRVLRVQADQTRRRCKVEWVDVMKK